MTDNWDDGSDDEWDVDDDALDAKLGIKNEEPANQFDDEEDLALKEKADQDKANQESLKKKGSALAAKKLAEKNRLEELEIARKAMELEAEMESKLSVDDKKELEHQRQEESDMDFIDAFGGGLADGGVGVKGPQQAGDKVVLKDIKDHMKHARRVAEAMKVRVFAWQRSFHGGESQVFAPLKQYHSFLTLCRFSLITGPRKDPFRRYFHQGSNRTEQRRVGRRRHYRHHQDVQCHQERKGASGQTQNKRSGSKIQETRQG